MPDSEWIRVRSKTGPNSHYTIHRATYDADPESYDVVKSGLPAALGDGDLARPREATHHTDKGGAAVSSKREV